RQWARGGLAGAEPVGVVRPLCVRRDDLEAAAAGDGSGPGGSDLVKRSELRLVIGAVLAVAMPVAILEFTVGADRRAAELSAAPFAWRRLLLAHLAAALPLGLVVAAWLRSRPAVATSARWLWVVLGVVAAGIVAV